MTANHEVTAADIARIAGVGRAAVSNWRRRHADFPAPVGGPPNSPTFALADVEAWLDANGRAPGANAPEPRQGRADPRAFDLTTPIAALLPLLTAGAILDPAYGDGSLLAATAERFGSRVTYVGEDADAERLDAARASLAASGATRVELVTGIPEAEGLAAYRQAADAVVSFLPPVERPLDGITWEYGQPSRNDYPLAWVQICLSYVKPGGVAVVTVPFGTAVRASGRRLRAELLRSGVLTHVITLPDGILAAANAPWQIWMLTRPADRPAYVLRMVDLTGTAPEELPRDEKAWSEVFADPARTRDVPSIELLDEDVLLVPSAHVAGEVRDVRPEYDDLRRRYAEAAKRVAKSAPGLTIVESAATLGPLVSIGDLVRSGALRFVERDAIQPGDVIIPSAPGRFDTTVVEDTDEPDVKGVSIIRCEPDQVDPYFLACFLRSETNRRQATGTMGGTFRLDVRRARVPRMPPSEQRRYGEAFRRLTTFADGANEVAAAATEATRTAIDGLTSGVFAPTANGK